MQINLGTFGLMLAAVPAAGAKIAMMVSTKLVHGYATVLHVLMLFSLGMLL